MIKKSIRAKLLAPNRMTPTLRAIIRTTITIRTAIVRAASVVLKTHYCFLVQLID
ncbi:MAG TPA: hypothetical protein PK992_02915 [Planctomycetaceae bacterium]|jgi:hypothetical protein|nr:hypothetical protein [Planctomycetaceae bacterium]